MVNISCSSAGTDLPTIKGMYMRRCFNDPHHTGYALISLLPFGRRYRSQRTIRFKSSFFPANIRPMDTAQPHPGT